MRVLLVAVAVVVGIALGVEQAVAEIALRDDARSLSWAAHVPVGLALGVDDLSPALPLPTPLRIVLGRRALEDGRLDLVQAHLERIDAVRDRDELAGSIAERRGDEDTAVSDFLAAGDIDGVTRRVDQLVAAGQLDKAVRLEQLVVDRFRNDPSTASALPDAYYELGKLEQAAAYRLDPSEREPLERQSLHDYESAVSLAPLELRYLIAAGNELINLGDLEGARKYFVRARDLSPNSADPLTGFGDIALRMGNVAEARAYLEQAERVDPYADSVLSLKQKLESR